MITRSERSREKRNRIFSPGRRNRREKKLPFGIDETRRSAPLGRIQNVEMQIPSPLHWLLDYGNVVIQTAAEFGALIFYAVPNPRAVADEILGRMALAQRRQEEEEAKRRSQDLPDWFEMYNRLEPAAPSGAEPRNGATVPQPAVPPAQRSGAGQPGL